MQFGLFYEAPEDARYTHAERYLEMLDLMTYGESLGFDAVWMAEIHFGGPFSLLSSPLTVVPAIAARDFCSTLRATSEVSCSWKN